MGWTESMHPRNPKGTGGGEFRTGTKSTAKRSTMRRAPAHAGGHGALSYNGKTGTGYGSKNGDPRVKKLQTALNRLGLRDAKGRKLAIDGKLGPLTTQAIKAWQRKNGTKPTGAVTAADLKKLGGARTHKKAHLTKAVTGSRK